MEIPNKMLCSVSLSYFPTTIFNFSDETYVTSQSGDNYIWPIVHQQSLHLFSILIHQLIIHPNPDREAMAVFFREINSKIYQFHFRRKWKCWFTPQLCICNNCHFMPVLSQPISLFSDNTISAAFCYKCCINIIYLHRMHLPFWLQK